MRRTGELKGMQFQLILIGEAIIGLLIAYTMFTMVNSIPFTTTDVVAKDLALTLSAATSAPNEITLNYKPNTSNYVISAAAEQVRVRGPETSSVAPIIRAPYKEINPNTHSYQPSMLISTDGETVTTGTESDTLIDYCNTLNQDISEPTVYVDGDSDVGQALRNAVKAEDALTEAESEDDAEILLVARGEGGGFSAHYDQSHGESYQKIACSIAAQVQSTHGDLMSGIGFESQSLNEKTVLLEYPSSERTEYSKQRLAESIIDGIIIAL